MTDAATDSSYFLDASDMIEMARLVAQDRLVTSVVSLLPPEVSGETLQHVLDIACGPGGWLLDLTFTYPHVTGFGIDSSPQMLNMANHLKKAEQRKIAFFAGDARQPLPFPDNTFDYINMRLTQSFIRASQWQPTLRECHRLLHSGGTLCITDLEGTYSTKPVAERLFDIAPRMYQKLGFSFSPLGRSQGLLVGLRALLPQCGFPDPKMLLHPLDASPGAAFHEFALENIQVIFAGRKEFIATQMGYSVEQLDRMYQDAMSELAQPDAACIAVLFSIYAKKTEQREE